MRNDYLIIHKTILPDFFHQVVKVRDLVENEGECVSTACERIGISRSTYYKYKDLIFYPSKETGRKAIIALKVGDHKGVLGQISSVISENNCSFTSVNSFPIKDNAYLTMTIDFSDYEDSLEVLVNKLRSVKYVRSVSILAID